MVSARFTEMSARFTEMFTEMGKLIDGTLPVARPMVCWCGTAMYLTAKEGWMHLLIADLTRPDIGLLVPSHHLAAEVCYPYEITEEP